MNINLMIVSEYLINAGKRIIVKLNKYTMLMMKTKTVMEKQ